MSHLKEVTYILLDKTVEVSWNNANKKHYIEKGYKFTHIKDKLEVKTTDLPKSSQALVKVQCDYCFKIKTIAYGYYYKSTKGNIEKYACSNCGNIKSHENLDSSIYFKKYLDFCINHNYTALSTIDDYQNAYSVLKYICPIHGEKKTTYAYIYQGSICLECAHHNGGIKNSKTSQEIIKIVESKNNNILLNPNDYINVNTNNLKIECGLCHNTFTTSLASIMAGAGACKLCGIKKSSESNKLSNEKVSTIINSINNNLLLNPDEYTSNSVINLKIKCGSCNKNIFTTSLANYIYNQTNRCRICSQRISKGELLVRNILDKYKFKYITEKVFPDCKYKKFLPFDFYLPDHNICIEFDGQFHYQVVYDKKTLDNTQKRDKIKNNYCQNNHIPLLRIPYWESDNAEHIICNFIKLHKRIKYVHNNKFNK